MGESGSKDDGVSSDRCLAGLTGVIGAVECVVDGGRALASIHASSDSESWVHVDIASASAVLGV